MSYLPPGGLPNPGIEPASLTSPALIGEFFAISVTFSGYDYPHFIVGKAEFRWLKPLAQDATVGMCLSCCPSPQRLSTPKPFKTLAVAGEGQPLGSEKEGLCGRPSLRS